MTYRKVLVEKIVIESYITNNSAFATLFSIDRDLDLEKAIHVLHVLNDRYYSVYVDVNELLSGLFFFDLRRKKIEEIRSRIYSKLMNIYQIKSFIEMYQDIAIVKTKKIYRELDELINDNALYIDVLKTMKKFHSNVNSLEEVCDSYKLKTDCANSYKTLLEEEEK